MKEFLEDKVPSAIADVLASASGKNTPRNAVNLKNEVANQEDEKSNASMKGVSSGESIKKSVTRARKRANMSSSHSSARSKKSIKLKNKREGGNSTIIEAS